PLFAAGGVRRDPLADQRDLQLIRRRGAGGRHYFIVANRPVDRWITVDGQSTAVALMDPMTGRAGLARTRVTGTQTEAYIQLDSGQSMILRTLSRAVRAPAWQYAKPHGDPVALNGQWTVSFVDGGPVIPRSFTSDAPVPWTGRNDD